MSKARKVNFFKAVLFWVKNKVRYSQIIATSLQNNTRKRKNCFSLYLQIIKLLRGEMDRLELRSTTP